MRTRLKWSAGGIASVILLAVLWPDSIPLKLTVTGVESESSGMVDESGAEMHLWSLTVTNTDSVWLMVAKRPTVDFRVGDDWVATDQTLDFGRIVPNRRSTGELLLPANATAYRLRVNYQTETWKARLLAMLGESGRRQLARLPWLAKHLWTDQWDRFPNPPRWKPAELVAEVQHSQEPRRQTSK